MPAAPGQQMEEHVIINVEFDNGVRGSKVTFGCREMVNFAFSEESGKMNLEQVFRLMIAQRKKGRPLMLALGLNDITMMALLVHRQYEYQLSRATGPVKPRKD